MVDAGDPEPLMGEALRHEDLQRAPVAAGVPAGEHELAAALGAARVTTSDAQRVRRELSLRSLFPSMPAAVHVRFLELLEDLELAPGQLAFAQGDPPDRFLFLSEHQPLFGFQDYGYRTAIVVALAAEAAAVVALSAYLAARARRQ